MTAYGGIQDAVAAMKAGAMDFLAKPVEPDHLLLLVDRAIAQRRLITEYALLKEELAARRGAPTIIGDAARMRQVSRPSSVPPRPTRPCCIEGRERHRQGAVRARGARAEPAIERAVRRHQLRGNPGDAARGRAVRLREGRVHRRDAAQAGQVRARPPRHVVPRRDWRAAAARCRGRSCARSRSAHVRSARRHRDRQGRCARGRGHESSPQAGRDAGGSSARILYFRLSVLPITVPPLRDREDDIPMLARHFIEKGARELGKKTLTLSPGRTRGAAGVSLAGQRARAAELSRARRHPRRRRRHPPAST